MVAALLIPVLIIAGFAWAFRGIGADPVNEDFSREGGE